MNCKQCKHNVPFADGYSCSIRGYWDYSVQHNNCCTYGEYYEPIEQTLF